ncbi:hypothetical protein H2203_006339 [Taxawa tesnikishii (nom. ined.)]|nr:hypothetical protein H2203_006339 [Dothideales sp. JES 119]
MATLANLSGGAQSINGNSNGDPFTATPTQAHPVPHRYASFDNQLFSLYSGNNSPSQAKRALEAHLKDTERRIQDASRLGTTLLQQRKELAARLKEVEQHQNEEEISPELQKKLAELEKEIASVEATEASVLSGDARGSPSKVAAPSRRQRNQPSNRVHDIEFATEISTSLLAQVRQLQAVLAEKDDLLRQTSAEKSMLEAEYENIRQRLRIMDENEQRYKDENWNLETQLQEVTSSLKEAADKGNRLNQALKTTLVEKEAAQRELEDLKDSHGKLSEDHALAKRQQESELHGLRREIANNESERDGLLKKIEELTSQNTELAKAVAYRWHTGGQQSDRDLNLNLEDPTADQSTPEHSPPPSPSKATPRHGMLESETLRSSLNHAHRMIQNLKNNIHREKTEKLELKRMLQDARDEIESRRNEGTGAAAKKRRSEPDNVKFRKPLRPDRLGANRTSREEIILDDEDWEEHDGEASPSKRATIVGGPSFSFDHAAFGSSESTDAFETATERDTDAFETANERDGTTTEAFQTAESVNGDTDDDLTETEGGLHRAGTVRASRPSPLPTGKAGDRRSYGSTASTSADEFDEVRTPVQAQQPKYKLRVGRGRRSARASELFGSSIPETSHSPAASFSSSNQGTPVPAGQSLSAELDALSDDDDTIDGTPSRLSVESARSSPEVVRQRIASGSTVTAETPSDVAKPQMVDSGMMTEPWEPTKTVVESATDAVGGAIAGAVGFVFGRSSVPNEKSEPETPVPSVNTPVQTEMEVAAAKDAPLAAIATPLPDTPRKTVDRAGIVSSTDIAQQTAFAKEAPLAAIATALPETPTKAADTSGGEQRCTFAAIATPLPDTPSRPIEDRTPEPKALLDPEIATPKKEAAQRSIAAGTSPRAPLQKLTEIVSQHAEPVSPPPATAQGPQTPVKSLTPVKLQTPVRSGISPFAAAGTEPLTPRRDVVATAAVNYRDLVSESARVATVPAQERLPVAATPAPVVVPASQYREEGRQEAIAKYSQELQKLRAEHETIMERLKEEHRQDIERLQKEGAAAVERAQAQAASDVDEHRPLPPRRSSRRLDMLFDSDAPQIDAKEVVDEALGPKDPAELPANEVPKAGAPVLAMDSRPSVDAPETPSKSRSSTERSARSPRSPEPVMYGGARGTDLKEPTLVFGDETDDDLAPPYKKPSGSRVPFIEVPNNIAQGQRDLNLGITESNESFEIKPLDVKATQQSAQLAGSSSDIENESRQKYKMPVAVAPDVTMGSPVKPAQANIGQRRSMDTTASSDRHVCAASTSPDHYQKIAAAGGKVPMGVTAGTSAAPAPGSMGPPTMPASAYKNNQVLRPRTPSMSAQSTTRGSATTRAQRAPSRAETASPISRRTSVSSFASEIDERFKTASGVPYPADVEPSTDPRMIQAITQTMIGEFLWKYTRKAGRSETSNTRHRRFFWVHPYTRTLYWSEQDPSTAGTKQLKAKSVAIEAVRVISDDNAYPPGLHRKSLVVVTPGREVVFTAPTAQRHETWFNALSYLLLRTSDEKAAMKREDSDGQLNSADVEEFNPQFGRSASRNTGRSRMSLSSYNSRTTRTSSPVKRTHAGDAPSLAARQSAAAQRSTAPVSQAAPPASPQRRQSQNHGSLSGRLSSLSGMFKPPNMGTVRGSFSSRRSKSSMSNRRDEGAIYDASVVSDSAEDLRAVIERQEREADRLENANMMSDLSHALADMAVASWVDTITITPLSQQA